MKLIDGQWQRSGGRLDRSRSCVALLCGSQLDRGHPYMAQWPGGLAYGVGTGTCFLEGRPWRAAGFCWNGGVA